MFLEATSTQRFRDGQMRQANILCTWEYNVIFCVWMPDRLGNLFATRRLTVAMGVLFVTVRLTAVMGGGIGSNRFTTHKRRIARKTTSTSGHMKSY